MGLIVILILVHFVKATKHHLEVKVNVLVVTLDVKLVQTQRHIAPAVFRIMDLISMLQHALYVLVIKHLQEVRVYASHAQQDAALVL